MEKVSVIAPMGATVRGPATLGLSPDQAARRASVLKSTRSKKRFDLPEGVAIQFKHGETFEMDQPGRLNRQLFEVGDPEEGPENLGADDGEGDDLLAGADSPEAAQP